MPDFTVNDKLDSTILNGEGFPQRTITNDNLYYGDSYTFGSYGYRQELNALLGLTEPPAINNAIGGTTFQTMCNSAATSDNYIIDPTYNNRSTIITYGYNDVRQNGGIANSNQARPWVYEACVLGVFMGLSIPQYRIINAQDVNLVYSGTWTNDTTFNSYAKTCDGVTSTNDYVEYTCPNKARYIALNVHVRDNLELNWEISVNGTLECSLEFPQTAIVTNSCVGVILDMGVDDEYVVRVTNKQTTGLGYFNWLACWSDGDTGKREVLVARHGKVCHQWELGSGFGLNQYLYSKDEYVMTLIEDVCRTLKAFNLPVSYIKWHNYLCGLYVDTTQVHPITYQANSWAADMVNRGIKNA